MAEHRRSITTLAEAVDNVRETCEQYRLSVDKALTIAGASPEAIRRTLNRMTEEEQAIKKMCYDRD